MGFVHDFRLPFESVNLPKLYVNNIILKVRK